MIDKVENLLNDYIVFLKLTLNFELILFYMSKKNNENFCVSISVKGGPACNCIVIYCKDNKIILHINIYDETENRIKQIPFYYIKDIQQCKEIIAFNINSIIKAYSKIYKGEI
jgi:hypothetical protein